MSDENRRIRDYYETQWIKRMMELKEKHRKQERQLYFIGVVMFVLFIVGWILLFEI